MRADVFIEDVGKDPEEFLAISADTRRSQWVLRSFFMGKDEKKSHLVIDRYYFRGREETVYLRWESDQPIPTQTVNKKRMLFLDDRNKRVESARRQFGEEFDLVVVSNAKECLRKMSGEDWDEIRLDHDLDGDDFQDPDDPKSGMAIVRYLEKCGWPENKKVPVFRVHSSNVFAAWAMVKRLQALGFMAFWDRFIYDEGAK